MADRAEVQLGFLMSLLLRRWVASSVCSTVIVKTADTSSKFSREGGPAVLLIDVGEQTISRLRALGLLRLEPFDPEDDPRLRNRSQWILEPCVASIPDSRRERRYGRPTPGPSFLLYTGEVIADKGSKVADKRGREGSP